jgi:hypothetical protein
LVATPQTPGSIAGRPRNRMGSPLETMAQLTSFKVRYRPTAGRRPLAGQNATILDSVVQRLFRGRAWRGRAACSRASARPQSGGKSMSCAGTLRRSWRIFRSTQNKPASAEAEGTRLASCAIMVSEETSTEGPPPQPSALIASGSGQPRAADLQETGATSQSGMAVRAGSPSPDPRS